MSRNPYNKNSIKKSLVLSLGIGMISVSFIMTYIIGRTVLKNSKKQITKSIVTLTEAKGEALERSMTEIVFSA